MTKPIGSAVQFGVTNQATSKQVLDIKKFLLKHRITTQPDAQFVIREVQNSKYDDAGDSDEKVIASHQLHAFYHSRSGRWHSIQRLDYPSRSAMQADLQEIVRINRMGEPNEAGMYSKDSGWEDTFTELRLIPYTSTSLILSTKATWDTRKKIVTPHQTPFRD